jgi:oligopeptide transport system permease protein
MSIGSHHLRRWWGAPRLGAAVLGLMVLLCVVSLPYTMGRADGEDANAPPRYNAQAFEQKLMSPADAPPLGTDDLGRPFVVRVMLGGAISLGIGLAAALIAVVIGTSWGLIAGYVGGRVDATMMRIVDILYGLPYILLVVLLKVALEGPLQKALGQETGNIVILLAAIGAVSWLTLARVVRGQVLSLRSQPFVEAARACGLPTWRVLGFHVLPNLVGPIIVYTTLTVPQAILQESFLSFLGIGVQPPLPSWGLLAADGLSQLNPIKSHWWLLVVPCVALGLTLASLNFIGDGLRDRFDPRAT